jgi:hypothetical protein
MMQKVYPVALGSFPRKELGDRAEEHLREAKN